MRSKSCLLLAAVAPAVLALAACGGAEADPRGVDRDEVLLQVSATGRAETRPDVARFSAGVSSRAATAAEASSANNAAMQRVAAALGQLGIQGDDLRTQSLTVSRVDHGPERGRFVAENMVEVRVRDLARVSDAIGAATGAGANVVAGPNFELEDPETASRSAYAAAYRAARARAEAYAEAAGLRIVRVLAIRDSAQGGGPGYPPPIRVMSVEAPQEAGPPVAPGLERSEVAVRVDFALGE